MATLKDLLPNISVKADVTPEEFLDRIDKIASCINDIEIKKTFEADNSLSSISIAFKKADKIGLENLFGLFLARSQDKERVWISLSSTSWAEHPPSYDEYVWLIKEKIGSLVKKYNKINKTKRRFKIPSKEQLEPKLSPVIQNVFQKFVNSANKSFLHPNDWRNFYSLVRVCHNRRVILAAEELERLLLKAGFSDYYAEKLSCIYEHGRGILRKEYYPEHIQKIILSDEYIEKRRHISSHST